jgi:P27 family predicted phage terminase small subunit
MGGKGSGRIAVPPGLKLLNGRSEGRDSGGRPVKQPPRFERCAPAMPNDLDDVARAEWTRVVDALEPLDQLKEADYTALKVHCDTCSTYEAALKQVRAEGFVVVSAKTGVPHKNPAQSVVEVCRMHIARFAAEFGLTPASERNLGKGEDSGVSADDDTWNPFAGAQPPYA